MHAITACKPATGSQYERIAFFGYSSSGSQSNDADFPPNSLPKASNGYGPGFWAYEEHKEKQRKELVRELIGHSVSHGVGINCDGATDTDTTVLIQKTDLNLN